METPGEESRSPTRGTIDLPSGSPGGYRQVFLLALPAVLAHSSNTAMMFVDNYFVSKTGTAALGAMGIAMVFTWLLCSPVTGTLTAVNIFTARLIGAGKDASVGVYLFQALLFVVLAWVPIATIGFCSGSLLSLLDADPAIQVNAASYLTIRLLGIGPYLLNVAAAGFFEGAGRTTIPLLVTLGANILNAFLDWILVLGNLGAPALGIHGAAYATVIASAAGTLSYVAIMCLKRFRQRFQLMRRLRWQRTEMRDLLRLGLPQGINWFLDSGSWNVFVVFVVVTLGKQVAAAQQAAIVIMHVAFMPAYGFSIAATTLVGQYLGANDLKNVRRSVRTTFILAVGFMGMAGLAYLIFRHELIGVFNDEGDPVVQRVGCGILVFAALWQVFDGLYIAATGALRGAGDTRFIMRVGALFSWLYFLPLACTLCHFFGIYGAWLGATIYISTVGIVMAVRWRSERWRGVSLTEDSGGG